MTSDNSSPRKPRMKSAVRVRRTQASPFSDFMQRHFSSSKTQSKESSSTANIPSESTNSASTQQTDVPKRPRLGTLEGDGRRASNRSISAVENLAAQDRIDYLEQTSLLPSAQARVGLSKIKTTGGRATDGHAPQLPKVTEDDTTPESSEQAASDDTEDDIHESSPRSTTSQQQIINSNDQDQSGVSPKRRSFSTSPFSVTRPRSGSSSAVATTPNGSKSKNISTPTSPNSRSGESRLITPPRTGRKTSSPLPEEYNLTSSPSRDYRLRRPHSNVSIPTPVEEEDALRVEGEEDYDDHHHTDDVADYLDVVDPEVGALGYLSNIGNSIFLPNIPALYDRRPTHHLPSSRRRNMSISTMASQRRTSLASDSSRRSQDSHANMEEGRGSSPITVTGQSIKTRPKRPSVMNRVSSAVGWPRKDDNDEEFVKHIKDWRDMDEEERDELDEHVRMLLTKKSKFKRGAKGFYAFVKTPMGFIMTLYGFLVTFWGTAIVLFIFGWIHVGHRKRYWIEICDQILCALFAAVGLGFAPFRAVDTYRMIHIAHYHHLTWKRRQQLGLSELMDPNDLPRPEGNGSNQVSRVVTPGIESSNTMPGSVTSSEHSLINRSDTSLSNKSKKHRKHLIHHKKTIELPRESHQITEEANAITPLEDLGSSKANGTPAALKRNESIRSELIKEREDVVVLTKGEQEVLEHHQRKFHASHTFYRYHATSTHHAFPLDLMIVITCLLDCHSLIQAALGGCTWGIKYTHRPTALTATLITCSLSCNAVAGLIIYLGGRKTKKRQEVERRLRIALEAEALAKIERRRARGDLPDREDHHTPTEKTREEEQLADDKDRDRIVKKLGHLERGSSLKEMGSNNHHTNPTTSMEMGTIKQSAEGSVLK